MTQTIANFREYLGIPAFWTVIAVLTEFLGGILVALGAATRPAALGLAMVMLVAIFKVHLLNGFFMNWFGIPGQGHGIEYNLALLAGCVTLILGGAGCLSLDHRFCEHSHSERN